MIKSPARIRLERELSGLSLPECIRIGKIVFEPSISVEVEIFVDEGPFAGATVHFTLNFPEMYPHRPPKAHIHERLFHPNFDLEGHVCLNILRLDWNPVLGITAILFGLLSILLAPEGEEPLNQEAGEVLQRDSDEYNRIARACAAGCSFNRREYDNVLSNKGFE